MKLFSNKIKTGVKHCWWFIEKNRPLCNCLTGNKEKTYRNPSLSSQCLACLSITESSFNIYVNSWEVVSWCLWHCSSFFFFFFLIRFPEDTAVPSSEGKFGNQKQLVITWAFLLTRRDLEILIFPTHCLFWLIFDYINVLGFPFKS